MLCKNNDFEHTHLKRFLVPFFRQKKVHARFEISEKNEYIQGWGCVKLPTAKSSEHIAVALPKSKI